MLLLSCLLCTMVSVFAQVTIGSDRPPASGALLDLKQTDNATGGVTSTKGFILPRVELKENDKLRRCLWTGKS